MFLRNENHLTLGQPKHDEGMVYGLERDCYGWSIGLGDQMNMLISLDEHQRVVMERLAPYHSVWDLEEPRKVAGFFDIPGPIVSTISNWLYQNR